MKPLPIGIDDFQKLRLNDYYYVDKTLLIKELIDKGGEVCLFTRPRRFGKTLNLSMLRYFFEMPVDGVSRSHLFDGLKIMAAGEKYRARQEQYPVVILSLKSAKQPDFRQAYLKLMREIASEFRRHSYLLDVPELFDVEKERYGRIINERADVDEISGALQFLSECLEKHHHRKTVILIDEYDVPLENAYFRGFYGEMIDFIRSLFESALKTNESLAFSVITGCLRISKESIFTGLNNLKIISILNEDYGEYFGFEEAEVEQMLNYYAREDKMDTMKTWYDGYRFGQADVYNPWSVINYVDALAANENAFPRASWSNTSSNSIIRDLVEQADFETKAEIESLIAGEKIEKPVHEEITYGDIHDTRDNLWNFLFFTGYLKCVSQRMEQETIYLSLKIPNAEVRSIYRNTILTWFDQKLKKTNLSALYTALEQGDCDTMADIISAQLLDTISFYDYKEDYYHGFLAGLLSGSQRYLVGSNRESGNGRPDLLLEAYSRRGMAIIIEVKISEHFRDLEKDCRRALQQIEEQNYEAGVRAEGYEKIHRYGISFYKKDCLVMKL
ncbi:MAG: AAA family ATPase [Lachnospiraceae bacterium]|nr:AAA family ATPase [Lachnospiraceae bacterium]